MNGNQFIGMRVSEFQRYNDIGPIMGVAVIVDEEHEYQYPLRDTLQPNDYVLEVTCPYGSQAMAQTIYNSVHGKVYKGFSAQNAPLSIDAELGDAITVKDTYSMLAYQSLEFGPGHMSEAAAPGDNELENEYPWLTSTRKEFDRVLATTRSWITKTSDEITLKVERVDDKLDQRYSELTVNLNGITSTVSGIEGDISQIEQRFDKIKLSVNSSGGITNSISITTDGINFSAVNLDFSGLVTFSDLSGAGKTVINGANITTGKIDAEYLNLTGAITFNDLTQSVKDNISNAYDMAYSAQNAANEASDTVSGWTYGDTTYIDGSAIWTDNLYASNLKGGTVYLVDNRERDVGYLYIRSATSSDYAIELRSDSSLSLNASDTLYIEGGGTHATFDNNVVTFGGDGIGSAGSGLSSCGTSRYMWSDVYAVNGSINTSDRNEKTDIEYGLKQYDKLFDSLKPCTFRFKDGIRIHQGMIAQDVEDEINALGIDSQNFAAFIKFNKQDENGKDIEDEYGYALRYTEFIPTLIWQVQQLKKRVNELERMIPQ